MRCRCCGGPFHPATGDWDAKNEQGTCGACYRPFVKFVKSQMSRKHGTPKSSFGEAAATSIRVR